MKNTMLTIGHEATLTSNGTHHHACCKPVIAIDLDMTFNSELDLAEYCGVTHSAVNNVLCKKQKTVGVYELDENGNKVRKIGKTRVRFACEADAVLDTVMQSSRNAKENLNKANEENKRLKGRIAELNAELAEFRAWKKAKEDHKKAVSVAESVLEKCKAKETKAQEEYQLAIARRQNAERELAELKARNVYA